jgi:hypothetical protein
LLKREESKDIVMVKGCLKKMKSCLTKILILSHKDTNPDLTNYAASALVLIGWSPPIPSKQDTVASVPCAKRSAEDSEESAPKPKRSLTGLLFEEIKVMDEEHPVATRRMDEECVLAIKEEIKRKDEEHATAIKVKDEEHAAAIKVKDEEHAAAIKVKDEEHAAAIKVKDEEHAAAMGVKEKLAQKGYDLFNILMKMMSDPLMHTYARDLAKDLGLGVVLPTLTLQE